MIFVAVEMTTPFGFNEDSGIVWQSAQNLSLCHVISWY